MNDLEIELSRSLKDFVSDILTAQEQEDITVEQFEENMKKHDLTYFSNNHSDEFELYLETFRDISIRTGYKDGR